MKKIRMNVKECLWRILVFSLLSLLMGRVIGAQEIENPKTVSHDTFSVDLLLESVNGNPQHVVLTLGAQEGATNRYDSGYDQFVPPPFPGMNFEAYFPYDHPVLTKLMRDIRDNQVLRHVWTVVVNGSEGTMTWYPHTLPRQGTFMLDGLINMRVVTTASFTLMDTMIITFNRPEAFPDIDVDVISYDFGDVLLGEFRTWTFPIFNVGSGDLIITAVTLDQLAFSLVSPAFPRNVAPSDSLNVTISFTPSILGPKAGNLFIYSNDPDESTIFIALLGTGACPEIDIATTNYDFGEVAVGDTGEWELMVYNRGSWNLVVDTLSTDNPRFTATPDHFSIDPGDSQAVAVHFQPLVSGPTFGALIIESNDLDEPTANVFLAGTGVTPEIELSATHHDFGIVALSDTGEWTLVISNIGALDLMVDTIAVSPPVFSAEPHSFTLSAGDSQPVAVSFAPVSIGHADGQLRVVSNDPDEPLLTVSLTGEGVQENRPDIYLEETGYDFGQVEVGRSALWRLNVINLGTVHLVIGYIHFSHPAFSAEPNSFTVSPSNLQEVRVTFAPTAVGSVSSAMTITSNDPDESEVSLSLTGVGIPNTSVEEIFGRPFPEDFTLFQNVPNPFNGITDIRYRIPAPSRSRNTIEADRSPVHTTLTIYNTLGQRIRTLIDEVQEAGYYTVSWDGRDDAGRMVSSGIYCYRLHAGRFVMSKTMLLLQ